jgi:hypothetical protein
MDLGTLAEVVDLADMLRAGRDSGAFAMDTHVLELTRQLVLNPVRSRLVERSGDSAWALPGNAPTPK